MAENQERSKSQQAEKPAGVIGRVTHAITKDGMLAAAFRQGADELGKALRAFPDTIHAEEPGTFLNPTVGEIADKNRAAKLPSPSEIAKESKQPYRPEPGHGQEHGRGR